MKKSILIIAIILVGFYFIGCQASGHRQQPWKPHSGKKMKAGKNH